MRVLRSCFQDVAEGFKTMTSYNVGLRGQTRLPGIQWADTLVCLSKWVYSLRLSRKFLLWAILDHFGPFCIWITMAGGPPEGKTGPWARYNNATARAILGHFWAVLGRFGPVNFRRISPRRNHLDLWWTGVIRRAKWQVSEGGGIQRCAAVARASTRCSHTGAHVHAPLRCDKFRSHEGNGPSDYVQASASLSTRPRPGWRSFSRARPTVLWTAWREMPSFLPSSSKVCSR